MSDTLQSQPKPAKDPSRHRVGICLPAELLDKLNALGGSAWVRKKILSVDPQQIESAEKPHRKPRKLDREAPSVIRSSLALNEDMAEIFKKLGGSPWLRQQLIKANIRKDCVRRY